MGMKANSHRTGWFSASSVGSVLPAPLLLCSCIVIPVPNVAPDPYQREASIFEVGITTKSDVIEILGEPTDTYFYDTEFLYTESAWNWAALVATYGGSGFVSDHNDHFLLIRFDRLGLFRDFRISEQRPDTGPVDMMTPIASAFGIDPGSIEFVQKGIYTRTFNTGATVLNREGILCRGPDFIGFAAWSPSNRYVVLWELEFNEIQNVSEMESGWANSVVLDLQNGDHVTFALSKRSLGMCLVDEETTSAVAKDLAQRIWRTSDPTPPL